MSIACFSHDEEVGWESLTISALPFASQLLGQLFGDRSGKIPSTGNGAEFSKLVLL